MLPQPPQQRRQNRFHSHNSLGHHFDQLSTWRLSGRKFEFEYNTCYMDSHETQLDSQGIFVAYYVTLKFAEFCIIRLTSRGVQYVHWVMHKCIMVKVGGKRNTHEVCKKQVNFSKTRGKFVKAEGK